MFSIARLLSQVSDSSQDMDTLQKKVDSTLIKGIVKGEIPIRDQPGRIRFEVAHEWLKLCQQGSEAFTQRSPDDKAGLINYIRGNLQKGRQCGLDQKVNELECELNRFLIQKIVEKEIPIDEQPDTICFEVAHEWLKLCQQSSEAFTQKSPDDKDDLIDYIRENLQKGRQCGLDQKVNELECELNRFLIQKIVKREIPIYKQPGTICFEVAHEWLKLCQQGSEAFTQRSPAEKALLTYYIWGNLQKARQCGLGQKVNELECELDRFVVQKIVEGEIPIRDQPDTICFEVAHEWLKLCQQGSEAFTQRSPAEKVVLIDYIRGNLKKARQCGLSQKVNELECELNRFVVQKIVKKEISIRDQQDTICFEVAHEWLKLCQQGSEAFTQRSPYEKAILIDYIRENLQKGRQCGLGQKVNELECELNRFVVQKIVEKEIPIRNQPGTIYFEVAHEWLKLCQQGSEAFTQRSPYEKVALIDYIRENLQKGRQCGLGQKVNELECELNRFVVQKIVKDEIPIRDQPGTIRFEVAHEWLKLCQQGSEAFTQRSPDEKAIFINYIRRNLKKGRQCGLGQKVNELECELNRFVVQKIVEKEIPIDEQPDTICFEVAHEWLKLCQQGSEAFTQRSPAEKAILTYYIWENLQKGRQCGLGHKVNELECELNKFLMQKIIKKEIPIDEQPDTICFEVAHEWLMLCQQGSEVFTQRSPAEKVVLIDYIRGNLKKARQCGLSQKVNELECELNRFVVQKIVKKEISIRDQPDTICFEVAHEWLKLCQQGSEAFTQRSPYEKAILIDYIRENLQKGRQCGLGQKVNELECELNRFVVQKIVEKEIPIRNQPGTICFEVAHEWLKLCQQGSEAFTQRSPAEKVVLIDYIRGNLKKARQCGLSQKVNELECELNRFVVQKIVKKEISIRDQPDTICFEVAHEWLKLCQQGSEAFTQRSPYEKAILIDYIRENLQKGRQCGLGQKVNELECELNRFVVQKIVEKEIPIRNQPSTICFEVAHEWLKLCQQGSEAFTQRSPAEKVVLIDYIRGNLQKARQCGLGQKVNELECELNRFVVQKIVEKEIPIDEQPDTICFEVAHEWLKLCQQDSEAFTQKSPDDKDDLIDYIRENLQKGRQCGLDQKVNELECELNKFIIQKIVKRVKVSY